MELTRQQIIEFSSSPKDYEEAEKLVDLKAITSLEVDSFSDPKIIFIHATIYDHKQYHIIDVAIEKDDFTIVSSLCSKDQFSHCHHVIAVLIQIYRQQPTEIIDSSDAKQLIATYLQLQDESLSTYVHKKEYRLLCYLHVYQKSFAISFRIFHRQYSTTIKDITAFLNHFNEQSTISYTQSLLIHHHLENFDDVSKSIISFMQQTLHTMPFLIHSKYLVLNECNIDTFFHINLQNHIAFYKNARHIDSLKFSQHTPVLDYHLLKHNQHYTLECISPITWIARGLTHDYILIEDHLYQGDKQHLLAAYPFIEKTFFTPQLQIEETQLEDFILNVLLYIQKSICVHGLSLKKYQLQPLIPHIYIDVNKDKTIALQVVFQYGDKKYLGFSNHMYTISRNKVLEQHLLSLLSPCLDHIYENDNLGLIKQEQHIYHFISNIIPSLQEHCKIYMNKKDSMLQLRNFSTTTIGVKIQHDLILLNFKNTDFHEEELKQILLAYKARKKYIRLKNGSFINLQQDSLQETMDFITQLGISQPHFNEQIALPIYRAPLLDTYAKRNTLSFHFDSNFKHLLQQIQSDEDVNALLPKNLKTLLRPYQKEGYRWLYKMGSLGFGALLADDMGIGKTIQTIALIAAKKQQVPSMKALIVCPSSVVYNWHHEIKTFASNLKTCIIQGTKVNRSSIIHDFDNFDIFITSYDCLKRDIKEYEPYSFTYQVLDEAQYIKNQSTKNFQSAIQIHATHKIALTGTPIENSLSEIWAIFEYLMPGYLYSYQHFKDTYEIPIIKEQDPMATIKLKQLLQPFLLRRMKQDVLDELPTKIDQTMLIEMDEVTKKLYHANITEMKIQLQEEFTKQNNNQNKFVILSMITKLRQLCCDPSLLYENIHALGSKMIACKELVVEAIQANKKVLIFSQFTSLLKKLEEEFIKEEIPYYLLKGSTPKQTRNKLVNAFNHDHTPVFLISLKAGGTGINLTGADIVIHFDPWWNISAQNQATDRAYRMGQQNHVQVIKLIMKDTIEEKIMTLQAKKEQLSDDFIQTNDGIITGKNKEELFALFTEEEDDEKQRNIR